MGKTIMLWNNSTNFKLNMISLDFQLGIHLHSSLYLGTRPTILTGLFPLTETASSSTL